MLKQVLSRFYAFFPTCQVRVVRFSVSCPARLPPPAFCSTSSAGPQLQPQLQALDCSGPLNCKLLIAVVPAGPQLQAPDQSGPCRSLTASSKCSPPDFNHKESPKIYQIECQKECLCIYVEIGQKVCQNRCQIECQKECQNICQKECQVECQNTLPDGMSETMSESGDHLKKVFSFDMVN